MPDPIVHAYTDFPVCPYCGEVNHDTADLYDATETDCPSCGKTYKVETHTIIEWTTERKADD